MKKKKYPKLPASMTNGQQEELKRDILNTFLGCDDEDINEEAIYLWATNTSAFYNWFYPRFERRLSIRKDSNELNK